MPDKSFHILEQHIVNTTHGFQILFICKGDAYFMTSNGGFGQRDMYIEQVHESEALKLLNDIKPKSNG